LKKLYSLTEQFGKILVYYITDMGEMVFLTIRINQQIFSKPFEGNLILEQMVKIGVQSVPVAITVGLFTGMVLALQAGYTLETKIQGVSQFIGSVVSISMVRELGPVLTAMVIAGRMGSAVAAEIGTMQVTEQIDALYTLAANPIKYLGVPRFLAFTFMLPLLTIFADMVGWVGGLFVCSLKFTSSSVYIDSTRSSLEVGDIMGGLIKATIFGAIIAVVACRQGFATTNGAEGVGRATTNAVVFSFMIILITDYFLTAILTILNF
jgi:phospholipid/cholesterol/gamma-HCH transport system permease protein